MRENLNTEYMISTQTLIIVQNIDWIEMQNLQHTEYAVHCRKIISKSDYVISSQTQLMMFIF